MIPEMVSDLDIFRSAQVLIREHGDDAGIEAAQRADDMLASIAEIEASTPNFHSYTATGAEHCIINQSTFYTREVNGVRFSDWLTNLLATGDPGTVVP